MTNNKIDPAEIEFISNQLCKIVSGDLDFYLSTNSRHDAVQKLAMLINFSLEIVNRTNRRLDKVNHDLKKGKEKLTQSIQELHSFCQSISHDLREPLLGIHAYLTFLHEDCADTLDEKAQQKIKKTLQLSKHMELLMSDLLEYSQISLSQLTTKESDIDDLVKEKIEVLEGFTQTQNGEVIIIKKLPVIYCDPIRTKEVFHNLITNALKYNNSKKKRVEIDYSEDANFTTFSIKDNGIGISESDYGKVFEMFRRLHGKNEYGGGTGYGLAVVKRIIERHGGHIWLKSQVGQGTTFYFTYPKNIPLENIS